MLFLATSPVFQLLKVERIRFFSFIWLIFLNIGNKKGGRSEFYLEWRNFTSLIGEALKNHLNIVE